MKVTFFGATGKTGQALIDEGLKRHLDITVFARTGSPFDHPGVRVVRGSLTDPEALRTALRGSDAVVSALGPTKIPHPGGLPITTATQALMAVMQQEGVRRLVAVSTGTALDPADTFDWKIRLPAQLIRFAMPSAYRDILGLAQAIRGSALDWTMVRVALLTDDPAVARLQVGPYGRTQHALRISRKDVAAFMLDQLSDTRFLRAAPGISAHRA